MKPHTCIGCVKLHQARNNALTGAVAGATTNLMLR